MTESDVAREIACAKRVLESASLLLDWNDTKSTAVKGRVKRVTFTQDDTFPEMLNAGDCYSMWTYLSVIEGRCFTFLLVDGGVVQMSYTVHNRKLKKHRLLYLPCPFSITDEMITEWAREGLGFLDGVESLAADNHPERIRLVGALRIDCDPNSARPGHPSTHAHLGMRRCRVPVSAPLSPAAFMKFVISRFYSSFNVDTGPLTSSVHLPHTITKDEMSELHLNYVRKN